MRVVLKDYPVQLGLANIEHIRDWTRELQLMKLAPTSDRDVPERLRRLVDQVMTTYAREFSDAVRARLDALSRGAATTDIVYDNLPAEAAALAQSWQQTVAEVDRQCATGELLTLQRPAVLVRFNDWLVAEFVGQLSGELPRPWDGPPQL